jgi:hypothetical protein
LVLPKLFKRAQPEKEESQTFVLIFLPVLLDVAVEDLDEVVDVPAAAHRVPNELERVGDRYL